MSPHGPSIVVFALHRTLSFWLTLIDGTWPAMVLATGIALGSSGCATRPMTPPSSVPAQGEARSTEPVVIKLDNLSIVPPQERVLAADWYQVMGALEHAAQNMNLRPSGIREWKPGRAFPLYATDDVGVAVLMQCMARPSGQTWLQVCFFEGPEKDKAGRVIPRQMPRGAALYDVFWKLFDSALNRRGG